ncbi:aminoglycoside phosphotransferase family protein [Patescibacteria group bacterium]|nr:aminoglycoside phosphotransferase family protein [Patescibacteria group bacterium]
MNHEFSTPPEDRKEKSTLPLEELRELAPAVFDVNRLSQEAEVQLTLANIARAGRKEDGSLEKYVVGYTGSENRGFYISRNTNHSMPEVHKNMVAISEQMPGGTVPRPVTFLEDADAVLYEEVAGINGLEAFGQLSEAERLEFFRATGERTRQLHEIDKESIATKETNTSSLLEHIMQTVNRDTFAIIQERNQDFFSRLHNLYAQIVEREQEYVKGSELVVNHGDLHPENVIRDESAKVGLMDFTDIMIAPRAKDIGGFFEQLKTMLHEQGFTNNEKIEEYQQEFLKGYGDDVEVPEEEMELYRAWQLWRNSMYFAGRAEPDFAMAEEQLAAAQELMDNQ